MSPSGDIDFASNSTATSDGSFAFSHSGLFFTPGDNNSPFTVRQNPPELQ